MADQKLDTEIRREQIAEAALRLVAERGVGRLSVAAVARRVGLVPSGIYRHFKSKDEILAAVLDLIESRLLANVEAARQDAREPLDQLHGILVRHVRFIREGRAFPRIVFSDDAHGDHSERKARVQKITASYLGEIGKIVRQGQGDGTIRPGLDPATVALMFLGMVVPGAILWHLSDGGFDVTRHAERAWQMFCTAVAVEGEGGAATKVNGSSQGGRR